MALPKLNQAPSYELIIPSTGEKLDYRPFLVKEQKILLMALETQDEKAIIRAVHDTLSACIISDNNVIKLKMFDIEYIFVQMRGKSIGEAASLTLKCSDCETENPVSVPLSDIELTKGDENLKTKINIGDKYVLNLSWPNFKALMNITTPEEGSSQAELLYQQATLCLESLDTEDEKILFEDETDEAKQEFMGSLTTEQFNDIMKFTEAMPALVHDIEFICTGCQLTNTYKLRGMQDFF